MLLLHGGPGLSSDYLQPVVDELAAGGYQVALYQQRGVPPSTARAPYDVATQVADVLAVLDALGWERAIVAGHSWGGHLLLHVLAQHPERVSAALVIDTLGGVGDGGEAEFDAEMIRRLPPGDVARARSSTRGDRGPRQRARPDGVAAALLADLLRRCGRGSGVPRLSLLRGGLRGDLRVAARRAARARGAPRGPRRPDRVRPRRGQSDARLGIHRHGRAIGPAARVEMLGGAGHFPWLERPGALRAALDRLVHV